MTEYEEETNIWKIITIVVICLILLAGLIFGGIYLKNKYKQSWQQQAYKDGINDGLNKGYEYGITDGQRAMATEQLNYSIVYTFNPNTNQTKVYKVLQVEEIQLNGGSQ